MLHPILLRLQVDTPCPSVVIVALKRVHGVVEEPLDLPGDVCISVVDPVLGGGAGLPCLDGPLDLGPLGVRPRPGARLAAEVKVAEVGENKASNAEETKGNVK